MSKDEQRCDSLQFSLHNLQISLSRCSLDQTNKKTRHHGGLYVHQGIGKLFPVASGGLAQNVEGRFRFILFIVRGLDVVVGSALGLGAFNCSAAISAGRAGRRCFFSYAGGSGRRIISLVGATCVSGVSSKVSASAAGIGWRGVSAATRDNTSSVAATAATGDC